MDLFKEITTIQNEVARCEKSVQDMVNRIKLVEKDTKKFLALCLKMDIKLVSISAFTDKIPVSKTFPFSCSGSAFTLDVRTSDGWPAIWRVCELIDMGGCGNYMQHQIDDTRLVNGVYEYKDGYWKRVE